MKLWVARDLYGDIWLFTNRPYYCSGECWCDSKNGEFMLLNKNQFSEVTFENSPQEVELKLIK